MSDTKTKVPTLEEIAVRAYEIYSRRGAKNGNALDDWLAAEKELSISSQTDSHGSAVLDAMSLRKRAAGF